MPLSSPLPSPMALNKPQSSTSMFKKRSSQSTSSPMASAASYLSALSLADARARGNGRSPTSTPALSLSSSITSSSEDTVLKEYELDNADGLALPARPPTSEQVFNTVHTEFGHCANNEYRLTSQHSPGQPVPAHIEQDPPYYILLSTYISYLILICLGHVRDFVGKRLSPSSYKHLIPRNVSDFYISDDWVVSEHLTASWGFGQFCSSGRRWNMLVTSWTCGMYSCCISSLLIVFSNIFVALLSAF